MRRSEQSLEEFLTESYARFRELSPVAIDPAWDRVVSRLESEPDAVFGDVQLCLDSARPTPDALKRWKILVIVSAVALCAIGLSMFRARSTPRIIKNGNDGLYQVDPPQFDAASIRLSIAGSVRPYEFNELPGGRLSVVNGRLPMIIMQAYGLQYRFQLIGGPNWMNPARYDIQAAAGVALPPQQMMLLVQRLLEDRFRLKVHRETRALPVYLLTVAKGGSKLHQSTEGSCAPPETNRQTALPRGASTLPTCGQTLLLGGRWDSSRVDIAKIVEALTLQLDRKVVNNTDLSGFFDIHIQVPPDPLALGDAASPSFFTIIEEQLGLKLVSDKGPVEVLVIDQVERPSEN